MENISYETLFIRKVLIDEKTKFYVNHRYSVTWILQ
jgi:hypothetical protein